MDPRKILSELNSFSELDEKLKSLTKNKQFKLAGDIFELASKYYLKTNPKYKTSLRNVWLLNEVDEVLKKKLNLPDLDEGIDLIAETYAGKFWSIQSKYRSSHNDNLTLSGSGGLATFISLTYNYCKKITHGLVLTTVNKPPKKVKLIKNLGFETLESWLSLDDNNFEGWQLLIAELKNKILKPKVLTPRTHQKDAIKNSLKYFENRDKGKIIMPCGSGKSLVAFWIAKALKAKKIIIAVPSLSLLQQSLKTWTREFLLNDIRPDWLCVCSDETVKKGQDDFVSFTYDLGVEVTTDKTQITNFLAKKSHNTKIIFTTYQSGKVTAAGSKGFSFDFGVMDEAHKTVGHKDKLMAFLINPKNISIRKKLFMTATERIFRMNADDYLSMDNTNIYGDIIYQLSFKKAIDSKPPVIADYKVITFSVSNPEIDEIYQSNKFIQVKKFIKDITAREFATAIALRKTIKKLKIQNAISFHSSILRAENFSKQQEFITKLYPKFPKINTFHVFGKMPINQRLSQVRSFIEKRGLITNARCLTEGVDIPAVDCVCFTDPKRSKIDIVQAAGRALRLSKNKKFGYILIPIFIPDSQNPTEAAKDTSFEEVISIVGALSTQDTRIAEYLDGVREGKQPPKRGSPIEGITKINALTKIDPNIFEKSINLRIWDKIGSANYVNYQKASEFAQVNNIKSSTEWRKFSLPPNVPISPDHIYKYTGWVNWGEFLGTGVIQSQQMWKYYAKYDEAIKILRTKYPGKFQTVSDWTKNNKDIIPDRFKIPSSPNKIYKNRGWKGWSQFLGVKIATTAERQFISLKETKELLRKKGIKDKAGYIKLYHSFRKMINNQVHYIPSAPHLVWKDWKGYRDLFGTNMATIDEFKIFVKKNKIKSYNKYKKLIRENKKYQGFYPMHPRHTYKNSGWKSSEDIFGTSYLPKFLSYQEAKKYIKKYQFSGYESYIKWTLKKGRPTFLPSRPHQTYKNQGWKGYADFFQSGKFDARKRSRSFMNYEELKKIVKRLKIKSGTEYKMLVRKRNFKNMPLNPDISAKYKGQWKGWKDFLGK